MAVNDIYRLALEGTVNDVDYFVNVFHYREITAGVSTDEAPTALMDAFIDDALPSYQALMYEGFAFKKLTVRQIVGGTREAERSLSLFGTGASSGEFLPYQNAAIISWRTGFAGRSNRGRTYLFPCLEGDQVGGNLSSGYITLMDAMATDFLVIDDGVLGFEFELVIWSQTLESAKKVVAGIPRGLIGTQRKRRAGAGS